MGLPGGITHPQYPSVVEVATEAGFKLQAGKGSDPDTLGRQLVYVYDTKDFPFYQAEIYHQFHVRIQLRHCFAFVYLLFATIMAF